MAATVRRDPVGLQLDVVARVGHCDGETALAHHRQVDDVVADIGDFVEADLLLLHHFAHGFHLVRLAHVDVLEAQIAGPERDGFGDALGDDGALQSGELGQRDPCAIVRVEPLGLDHTLRGDAVTALAIHLRGVVGGRCAGRRSREDPDAAVGQHAIHVKNDQLDASRPFLSAERRRHRHIPAL